MNCVICGEKCKIKLCGAQKCKNARKQQLCTPEQKAKVRGRQKEDRDLVRKAVTRVEAKCPRCLKHHVHRFEWGYTGKPLPYKYCNICAQFVESVYLPETGNARRELNGIRR